MVQNIKFGDEVRQWLEIWARIIPYLKPISKFHDTAHRIAECILRTASL
jgi:hypothetical protein